MRAAVFETAGQPLVIRDDVEIIAPRAGEVRVRVHYCGLCHSDYSVVSGSFPFMGPVIVGHEASGVVESVGPGVTRWYSRRCRPAAAAISASAASTACA